MKTTEEIKKRLWNAANELRGSMDASRYKDYMLGLMFYKFLSDKTLAEYRTSGGYENLKEDALIEQYNKDAEEIGESLFEEAIQKPLGYYVKPEHLYQKWIKDINNGEFELQNVIDSLNFFERTIDSKKEINEFKGLFSSSTMDLTDSALGSNLNERSKNIMALIKIFSDLDMVALQHGDILGDAYEYLIGMFAMESGKKAGEFYTPKQVSEVIAQIIAKSLNIKSVYDPTVGSGSLLLTLKKHLPLHEQKLLNYYGQEKNTVTYNLTRMNLLLHGVRPEKMNINNGDSLAEDWPEDPEKPNEGALFDAVVMNPPYSANNWNKSGITISDPRFEIAGVLPPNSKGDYAFLLHGFYHLDVEGAMGIVLPHGVLFRGASEGQIRKRLLEKNNIDTIIGLPSNLFTNTGIPVCILILKKNREINEPVLFIDASKSFIKVGKQNSLQEKDIAKIVDTYVNKSEIKGYSHLATREEIISNDYNLNIPRYIDLEDEEIPHDVDGHLYGGIPKKDIERLEVINSKAKDILYSALEEIRPGYIKLNKSIDEIKKEIFNSDEFKNKVKELNLLAKDYISKYWDSLKNLNVDSNINELRETMLVEIKEKLSTYKNIDVYDGFQIIAEIWNLNLNKDAELISKNDFYKLGRLKEPNYVTKGTGSKKKKEQQGWNGTLIPAELIKNNLFESKLEEIERKEDKLRETESDIAEYIENAKNEDSIENLALYDSIKKNDEDEPLDSFELKTLKSEIKNFERNSEEYNIINRVLFLLNNKSELTKEIKNLENDLMEEVYSKYEDLTNDEIDKLVYIKWFNETTENIEKLLEIPIVEELNTLKELNERYSETVDDIDLEIEDLEKELNEMMKDLVKTYE